MHDTIHETIDKLFNKRKNCQKKFALICFHQRCDYFNESYNKPGDDATSLVFYQVESSPITYIYDGLGAFCVKMFSVHDLRKLLPRIKKFPRRKRAIIPGQRFERRESVASREIPVSFFVSTRDTNFVI